MIPVMFLRVAVSLMIGVGIAQACTCSISSVGDPKAGVDIVFRGKIIQFKNSPEGARMAVFAVDRVWKGHVHRILEMPATETGDACWGFWPGQLKLDNELIVYVQDHGSPGFPYYVTALCYGTALAKDSNDFQRLGPGKKPK
jgi:hypothetical protein